MKESSELLRKRRWWPSAITAIMRRELAILTANQYLLLLVVVAPLLYPFLYSSVYVNKMERDIPIDVVDFDNSQASRQLIRDMDGHELLSIGEMLPDLSSAARRLQTLKTAAVIVIPSGFEADQKKGKQGHLSISVSNLRFLVASDINKALGDILAARARNVTVSALEKVGFSPDQAMAQAQPLQGMVQCLYNVTESYGDFIIAGLLALILQQTLLLGMSVSMSLEQENKTLGELFRISNGSIPVLIAGKAVFYILLFGSHALLFFTIYAWIYHIPMGVSPGVLSIATLTHITSIVVWALLLSSFFKDKLLALVVFLFTSYPVFLLSGFSWPQQLLPPFLREFSQLLPSTPFLHLYTVLTQMNGSWSDIHQDFYHMIFLLGVGLAGLWVRLMWIRNTIAVQKCAMEQSS